MIVSYPDTMRKALYLPFFLISLWAVLLTLKSDLFWLVGLGLFALFIRTLYLIYLNERFTAFGAHCVACLLFLFQLIDTSLIYLVAVSDYGKSTRDATSLAMIPVLLMLVEFLFIYFTTPRPGTTIFEIRENRICMESHHSSNRIINIIGGCFIAVGVASMIWWHVEHIVLASIALALINLYLLYAFRNFIRMLKKVLAMERKHNRSYTFEYIDQIREARSRWWLSRFLKGFISLSK